MKRGQTGLGLVILGVIAIIAVIGLVLLFTKASQPDGAAVAYGGYGTPVAGKGATYSWGDRGIAEGYQVPEPYGMGPDVQQPAPGDAGYRFSVQSNLHPSFLVLATRAGSVASLENLYGKCTEALEFRGNMNVGSTEYALSNWEGTGGRGNYPGASSGYTRLPTSQESPTGSRQGGYLSIGRTGGDLAVWIGLGGLGDGTQTQEQLNNGVISKVVGLVNIGKLDTQYTKWSLVPVANGNGQIKMIPVCSAGDYKWPFPQ